MKYSIVFYLLMCLISCSGGRQADFNGSADTLDASSNKNHLSTSIKRDTLINEDFKEFYSHFLRDSLFQISRLKFPLRGKKITEDKEYDWSLDNWVTIKVSIYEIDTTEYKVEINEEDPTYKIIRLFIPDSGFEFSIHFQIIDRKWYLVYCDDST